MTCGCAVRDSSPPSHVCRIARVAIRPHLRWPSERDDRRAHCLGFDSQHAGRNGETRTMRIRRSEAMPLWKRHASAAAAADQHEEAVTPRWRHAKRPSMRLWHASWNMNADHALKHASLDIMDWNTQDSVAEHTRRGMRGHGATVRHGGVIPWRHRRSGAS